MARRTGMDSSFLQAALIGYEQMKERVEQKIAEIRKKLGDGDRDKAAALGPEAGPKRRLSAAARKRIAEAQRKRWALVRAEKAGKSGTEKAAGKAASKES